MNPAVPNRVIVIGAIDRTPESDWVVQTASSLTASFTSFELHILHVVPARGPVESIAAEEERLADARAFVDRVVGEATERTKSKVVGHVVSGSAKERILELASDLEADLVVVGSHGKTAAGRLLLGSVSQSVVNDAPCAVLVARAKRPNPLAIAPPCPRCLEAQRASNGATMWCAEHAKRHVHAQTHHIRDDAPTSGSSNFIRP